MFGPDGGDGGDGCDGGDGRATAPGAVGGARERRGLAANAAAYALDALAARRAAGSGFAEASLGVSYVEVFGQTTTDLLSDAPICANRGANERVGHRCARDGPAGCDFSESEREKSEEGDLNLPQVRARRPAGCEFSEI